MAHDDTDAPEARKTGHNYDGIEELDHPPPSWFRALFYATIAFGLGYFYYYSLGDGPTLVQEYERAKSLEEYALYENRASAGAPKSASAVSEDELLAFAKDPARKALGASVYQAKCASCHGAHGQGGIGPNLTDEFWLHGGKMTEVLGTISKGVPDKGMPPWGSILSLDEAHAVTAHLRSIVGTKPEGAKEPQGMRVSLE